MDNIEHKTFQFFSLPYAAPVSIGRFRELELSSAASDAARAIPPSDANAPSRLYGSTAHRIDDDLFANRAALKMLTSQVAMHLSDLQRSDLFKQIDELLNVDDWTDTDQPILVNSFRTFLRFLIYYRSVRRPSLTVTTDGNIAASWFTKQNRLSMEFLDEDICRIVMSRPLDEDKGTETAAYQGPVGRIGAIVGGFGETEWYQDGTARSSG
jgi:hypothetical protein